MTNWPILNIEKDGDSKDMCRTGEAAEDVAEHLKSETGKDFEVRRGVLHHKRNKPDMRYQLWVTVKGRERYYTIAQYLSSGEWADDIIRSSRMNEVTELAKRGLRAKLANLKWLEARDIASTVSRRLTVGFDNDVDVYVDFRDGEEPDAVIMGLRKLADKLQSAVAGKVAGHQDVDKGEVTDDE